MTALLKTTQIQEPSSASVNLTLDTSGNGTFAGTAVMSSPYTMRNKIINGAMVIDQRNAGAAVTTDNYVVDRWNRFFNTGSVSVQQSSLAPAGFSNSLGVTITTGGNRNATSYNILQQAIEGYNIADFAMGTSSAKTVTLSFWVRSSLTGLFSGCMTTSDNNALYVFTYNISSANTWQYVSATIPGYTSGVWATNNTAGTLIRFDLGSGSNYQASTSGSWVSGSNQSSVAGTVGLAQTTGATFYITGVQLELGTVATPFEYRNYQQELAMCQRYYYIMNTTDGFIVGRCDSSTFIGSASIPVTPRAGPTISFTGTFFVNDGTAGFTGTMFATGAAQTMQRINANATGLTAGRAAVITGGTNIQFSMEL